MVAEDMQDDAGSTEGVSKKKKLIIIIAAIAVVLIGAVVGTLLFLGGGDDSQANVTEAEAGVKGDAAPQDAKNGAKDTDQKRQSSVVKKGGASKDEKTPAAQQSEQGDVLETDEPSTVSQSFGRTFALPRADLNLGNPVENRFIRIAVVLEYRGDEEQAMELRRRKPQLRDIVITSVSTKTRASLLSDKGKEQLRRELLNRINEVVDRPVQNVYFTEFFVE